MRFNGFPFSFAGPITVLAMVLLFLPATPGFSQGDVTSSISRYRQYEYSTGFYEEYEVRPLRRAPVVAVPGVRTGIFPYSPSAAQVRIRTRLADSHRGLKFYDTRKCEDCHPGEARNLHTIRAGITCRQCHGGEPIASTDHYFSPMNPIRRHAYICSKCHPGANVSFASYVVHEPFPGNLKAFAEFPALFAVFWIMVAIAAGTFLVFLPHTALWGLRELWPKKKEDAGGEPRTD